MNNPLDEFLSHLRQNGYEPVAPLRVHGSDWGRLMYNGEPKGKASGGYKLIQNQDGSYFASFGSSKDKDGFRTWKSGGAPESHAEAIARKVARDQHRRFLEQKERERHEVIGRRLARVVDRMPVANEHPYLSDKGIAAHGARLRVKNGELIIPRYGMDGKIYSLQRIIQKQPGVKSWKGYFKGALGKGLYYPLFSEQDDKSVIVIVEGFATGASVREATGFAVVVAFDSGNLAVVARGMRKRFPEAKMIIAGDSDQWTFKAGKKPKDIDTGSISGDDPRWQEWRADDSLYNPGVEKAKEAAGVAGGAHVLVPDFPPDHAPRGTDFNDLAREKGAEYVKLLFTSVLEIPQVKTVEEAAGGGFGAPDRTDVQTTPSRDGEMGMAFRVLGYNNGVYFYYPFRLRQIVALTAAGHSMNNLLQLDTLEAWEAPWRGNDGKLGAKHQTIALYAAASMTALAERKGVFLEEAHVRGAGCWIDDGRVVLHCGDALYVDGAYTKFDDLQSEYTYVAAPRLMRPAREALGNYDARRLRTICEAITWENQLSGTLLAGWLVIAPICAALTYRPHIYITGEAESGKSTIMDNIIKPVLGRMALCVDGGTTEPSIRQQMAYDARPLVYDEAEPSPSMADVIMLARKASTGAVVKKFGQRAFKARFCACFSAINPPVNKTADESRISFMHIKKNRRATAMQEYDDLLALIEETITPDFSERLVARTLENMETLIKNIRIFQRAMRKTIGGARASQQIGTMFAGVYLLGRTDVVTEEAAMELVGRFTWTDHAMVDMEGDPIRLVQWIAGSLVRTRNSGDVTIGELVQLVRVESDAPADKLLRQYGIAVRGNRVEVASRSQNLARLLKDTEWHDKWSRTLSDVAGAEKRKICYFSPGIKTSSVSLPIELFTAREDDERLDLWKEEPEGIEF